MTLAQRLTTAMLLADRPKVKQTELAAICGVKPPSVNDWLTGKSKRMDGVHLIKAAEFLGVRPKWLAMGVGPMRDASTDIPLQFFPTSTNPVGKPYSQEDYLLYNQCDGFHIAYASFDEDGFQGFTNWLGTVRYESDFYEAWAKLPDCNEALFPIFGRRPASPPLMKEAE
jgi:transcriptional regulator with XRE-family HTH domain